MIAAAVRCALLVAIGWAAYTSRLYAINEYGRVIHEFDPWFNYRATEYLAANGAEKFFKWYDYEVWYPLGRPVGTTIYPGMQFTSVYIWRALAALGIDMSLNDVCCFVPAWFGVVASMFLGLLAYEASGSANAAVCAAAVMSIVPAHIMRSVGGGYDNESVAVSALVATFYLWCRSLRTPGSWWLGAAAGLAYFYMVAAWGGYIFVINMIGFHAGVSCLWMLASGNYQSYLHHAYSLFYVTGTFLAIQVPVVGLAPLKSLEQLGAFAVFVLLQMCEFCEYQRKRYDLRPEAVTALRGKVFSGAAVAAAVVVALLAPTGYFGPLSSRIRGLLVPHTRTGNPLVDSVSEHQPARPEAYFQMLQNCCFFAPVGLVLSIYRCAAVRRSDAALFVVLYACVAYHFSSKMHRLLLLMGPIASVLTGMAVAAGAEWAVAQIAGIVNQPEAAEEPPRKGDAKGKRQQEKQKRRTGGPDRAGLKGALAKNFQPLISLYEGSPAVRAALAGTYLLIVVVAGYSFWNYSQMMAQSLSHPSIMFKARSGNGEIIMVDDYREAYWWLRDNTPEDSRVMAWWDYGYQINGVANRTTIADGNTWNHEHIATLGRCLASPVKEAHAVVRHLADYVLIWAGSGGDDLAKSPHMARIGNSVFHDICPGDPTCQHFGFTAPANLMAQGRHTEGDPTPMMRASLLYNLHSHGIKPGVSVDPSLFTEAYTSKYGKVRIFKVMNVSAESKRWVADPANRVCDAPGSWYCTGQYPPAIHDLIARRKAFRQLEDFNQGQDEEAAAYVKSYMQRMAGQSPYGS